MAKITPKENGPLIVEGVPNLRAPVGREMGADKPVYALCRCGLSNNKPYCDGSHIAGGFSSENDDAPSRNKVYEYKGEVEGKLVTVAFNPLLCGHIAECNRLHAAVFDATKRPWIQPENGTVEGIENVIKACPSGALRFSIDNTALVHDRREESEIQIVANGPYIVRDIDVDAEATGEGANPREMILCRCGLSKNKPFCDGTHRDENWKDWD